MIVVICNNYHILVGGFKREFDFPFHIWDVILPIDELIFFKMVKTTNQMCFMGMDSWGHCNFSSIYPPVN
jgi:hypothetical protein